MQSVIKLEKASKTYTMGSENVNALKDINLDIKNNEFVAILGPSGSGKSTMMNLVGCLDLPSAGAVYLDNQNISLMDESTLATIRGKKIGFVFQKFNLIPNLSALDNVALPALFQGKTKEERYTRAKELLSFVGLSHRLTHKPNQLSGGEQQRVAVARSMINDPDIILADEPTGNLDSKTGKIIMDLFQKLNKNNKTIILVTHDNNLAKYAKKIVRIKDGRLEK